jgi:hypothetical protein
VTVKVTVNPDTQQPRLNIADLALTTGGPVVKKFTKAEIGGYLQPRTVYMKKK